MAAETRGAGETTRLIGHWIGGRLKGGSWSNSGPVMDPARGVEIARVPFARKDEVDLALGAAHEAFAEWRRVPAAKRASIMFRFRDLVGQASESLANAISAEHGKTRLDALGEVSRGLEIIEFACAAPQLMRGSFSQSVATDVDTYVIREPLGVVLGITPFNFPAMVPMWMFPIALACGNTFVLKPSEKDPTAAVLLAELLLEAGLPDGVFNVLHGDHVTVGALLEDPRITAVSFVGSTPVAHGVYELATRAGKRAQALGGAKNHMVVLPDADLDQAADAAVSAGYGSAGERCMAISAVVAVGDVADELVQKIAERSRALKVGPADDDESEMGPLITSAHKDRVERLISSGVDDGATLALDGRGLSPPSCENGFFVGPTLFDRVRTSMAIYQEEIFGPVLCVLRCESFQDAIDLINASPYANGTAIFTRDGGAARQFEQQIEVGMVGVNVPIPVPVGFHSFGGWRGSLFGAHGIYGEEGVHFYTRQKVVTRRWPDPRERGVDLGFPSRT